MEKNILKIIILFVSGIKYCLYFCSVMICIGTFFTIVFKDRVISMLELEDIGVLMNKVTAFPFIILMIKLYITMKIKWLNTMSLSSKQNPAKRIM